MTASDLLFWLDDHTDLELAFRHSDDDGLLEGAWCVHRQQGGVNDREWRLIASGATPWYALFLAHKAVAKEAGQ